MTLDRPIRRCNGQESPLTKEIMGGMPELRTNLLAGAMRLTKDPAAAEDLVQATMTRALSRQHNYQLGTKLSAWLYRIMMNLFINDFRRQKRSWEILERYPWLGKNVDEQVVEGTAESTSSQIQRVLEDFGAESEKRAAMLETWALCDIEEYSYAEIAQMLDIPLGTVMSRILRVRNELAKRLAVIAAVNYGIRPSRGKKRTRQIHTS